MATLYYDPTKGGGNWSANQWGPSGGPYNQGPPSASGTDAEANGAAGIVIDVTSLTCGTMRNAGGGSFALSLAGASNITINANLACTGGTLLTLSGTTRTITVNGNLDGPTSGSNATIYSASNPTIIINGQLRSSTSSGTPATIQTVNGNVTVNNPGADAVVGGANYVLYDGGGGASRITVNGNVTGGNGTTVGGGPATTGCAIYQGSNAGTITLSGGTITGGSVKGAFAAYSRGTITANSGCTLIHGASGCPPIAAGLVSFNAGASDYAQFWTGSGSTMVKLRPEAASTDPGIANVKSGTAYAINAAALTGTLPTDYAF